MIACCVRQLLFATQTGETACRTQNIDGNVFFVLSQTTAAGIEWAQTHCVRGWLSNCIWITSDKPTKWFPNRWHSPMKCLPVHSKHCCHQKDSVPPIIYCKHSPHLQYLIMPGVIIITRARVHTVHTAHWPTKGASAWNNVWPKTGRRKSQADHIYITV